MSQPTKITIEPTRLSAGRGQLYRAVDANGAVLIDNSRTPELDACRALLARGVTGRLEIWRRVQPFFAMRLDIEKGAKTSVVENSKDGPRFAKWSPLTDEAFAKPVSRRSGSPAAPVSEIEVSLSPPALKGEKTAPRYGDLAASDVGALRS